MDKTAKINNHKETVWKACAVLHFSLLCMKSLNLNQIAVFESVICLFSLHRIYLPYLIIDYLSL